MPRPRILAILLAVVACAACAQRGPELGLLYSPSAQYHGPDRNPIIAIPGILGSKLMDSATGQIAWGAFEAGAANPESPDGARALALPIGDRPLSELRDEIRPGGVLEQIRISLLGIPLQIQAYAGILQTLGAGGYRDEALGLAGQVNYGADHFTCFQFDYDWRRDNVENAQRLHAFILEKREYVRAEYKKRFGIDKDDIQFDIAAHSMGGLVTRYLLMYGDQDLPEEGEELELNWAGADLVDRVILVGTPNGGSTHALMELIEGNQLAPILPFYPPALLGSFPSIYQLLPRSRHQLALWDGDPDRPIEDLLDPELWERMGWGLASPEQQDLLAILMPEIESAEERRAIALAYQRRVLARSRAFQEALDRPSVTPEGVELFLVAGDAYGTHRRLAIDSTDGSVSVLDEGDGDGTVLRSSALLDERVGGEWHHHVVTPIDYEAVLFLPENHLGLTQSAVFRDNVLYWLLEDPRRRVGMGQHVGELRSGEGEAASH